MDERKQWDLELKKERLKQNQLLGKTGEEKPPNK